MELTASKLNYITEIINKFPNTFFVWSFIKPGETELRWTSPKKYNDISPAVFWRKQNMFRTALYNNNSDEIRVDFDYHSLEENITAINKVISKLKENNINKFLIYHTGGKGLHLIFRFSFNFEDYDRADIRKALYNCLNVSGVAIDETLFRTNQVLGLEGWLHRVTNKPKQLITIEGDNINYLNKGLNFDYLKDNYINVLNDNIKQNMFNLLNNIKQNIKPIQKYNTTPPAFYKNKIFDWHISRFKEMYLIIEDGHKRLLDTLTRYIYLTTKNKHLTLYYYKLFVDSINLNFDNNQIISNVTNSINCIEKYISNENKPAGIFIYHDVLTKKEFYKTYKP